MISACVGYRRPSKFNIMNIMIRTTFCAMVASCWLICNPVVGQHNSYHSWSHHHASGCCPSCGCQEKPESKMYLVREFKKVQIPNYASQEQTTFYPAKGIVNHQRYANDNFVVNTKNRCGESCLTCNTVTGCQTNQGMTPAGCFKNTNTCRPVSVSTHYIPVLKWKKIETCSSCNCDYGQHFEEQPAIPHPETGPQQEAGPMNSGSTKTTRYNPFRWR